MRVKLRNGQIVITASVYSGSNITIVNAKVTVNGVVQDVELVGDLNGTIHVDVDRLENSCGKVVANKAGSILTLCGDVVCGVVAESVQTKSGYISCGNIGGSLRAHAKVSGATR